MEDSFDLADCFSDYDSDSSECYTTIEDYINFEYKKYNLEIKVTSEYDQDGYVVTSYHIKHFIYDAMSSVDFYFEDPVKYDDIVGTVLQELDITDIIKLELVKYCSMVSNTDNYTLEDSVFMLKRSVHLLAVLNKE